MRGRNGRGRSKGVARASKSGVTGIISNPFLAKLTIISFSDFSSKESLNLWGKVQADAKFPSHDG